MLSIYILCAGFFILLPSATAVALSPKQRRGRSPSSFSAGRYLRGMNSSVAPAVIQLSSSSCPVVTGGYCYIWDCDQSQATCDSGHCFCKTGFCAGEGGKCVPAPADPPLSVNTTSAPFYSVKYVGKCLNATNGTIQLGPCTETPEKFVMPLGGQGLLRRDANKTECVYVESDFATLRIKTCDLSATRMEFVLPPGGSGTIRASSKASRCIAVADDGVTLRMQDCKTEQSDLLLQELWGMSDEQPPPYFDCKGNSNCITQKQDKVLSFCVDFPTFCDSLKKCPSGCNNGGTCNNGHCECTSDFQGGICDEPVGEQTSLR